VLQRVILPALNVCGVCSKPEAEHRRETKHAYERNKVLPAWHGWHAFRRGLATNLNKLGVDDLTISRILRHSDVAVTQHIYIEPVSENAQAAMAKIENALTDTQVTPRKVLVVPPQVM
jgi:integrase